MLLTHCNGWGEILKAFPDKTVQRLLFLAPFTSLCKAGRDRFKVFICAKLC